MRKAHDTQTSSKKMRAKLLFVLGTLAREELELLKLPYVLCAVHRESQATVQADATFVCHSIVGGRPMRKQKLKEAKRRNAPRCFFKRLRPMRVILSGVRRTQTFKILYSNTISPKYPACAITKTYRKFMLVRRGGANHCCGGIVNLELGISSHNTRIFHR
jgi:hypothetical protein